MVQGGGARLVCVLSLLGALALVPAARASTYWGATISGEPYGEAMPAPKNETAWNRFERHAGRRVAILNQSQPWCGFDEASMNATAARGAIPLVTMGLPQGVTLAEIAEGKQDAAIKAWAAAAKAWRRPFLFAPWWEMNGAWYPWGRSPSFVAAWRRFHDLVAAQGATNVTWTWVANGIWSDPESDPSPYYPGDQYVDWTGIDSYNWGLNPAQPDRWITPERTFTPTLKIIEQLAPSKPVAIVETASSEDGGNKADWIRELLGSYLPHHPEIKAFLWFNWNFPKGSARADWPIETSAPAQQAFRAGIRSSVYVGAPASLPPLEPVPPPSPSAEAAQPGDLSPAAEMASGPAAAVAPNGTTTVVWSAREVGGSGAFAVFARRLGPAGAPEGPAQQLSEPGQDALEPQVAVGPDGTAAVVWVRSDGSNFVVQTRRIAADGGLGPAVTDLSASGRDAFEPRLALAPDGAAVVVWKRFDGADYLIKERRLDPGGFPGATSNTLSAAGGDAAEPAVAVAPDGEATVVWSRYDGEDSIVQARRVDAEGAPGEGAIDLSPAGESAVEPQVVVGPNGAATVAWNRFDGADWIVQAAALPPGGAPETAVADLSAAGRNAAEPALAVGPDGGTLAAWERWDGGAYVVQARQLSPDGAPGATLPLSEAGRDAAEPRLAIGPAGAAAISWSRFDGSGWVAQERRLEAAGSLGGVAALSAGGGSAGAAVPAWGSDGTLAFAWRRFGAGGDVVQAAVVPPPPPPAPPDPPEPAADGAAVEAGAGGGAGTAAGPGDPVAPELKLGKPRLDLRRGTARLPVSVTAPGRLLLSGGGGGARELRRPGTVLLRVRATGPRRRRLERRGSVRLRLSVVYVPGGGEPLHRGASVRLRMLGRSP